jgi:hypothetical protein
MRWQAVTYYQPFFSPQKRLLLAGGIVCVASLRCLVEYFEKGLTNDFWLYGGFALLASVWEWRHYHKPREISLELESGRLVYSNRYTGERHTVYQSRIKWIKEEPDALIFFSENSLATPIRMKYFTQEQQRELISHIGSWNKKMVCYGKE